MNSRLFRGSLLSFCALCVAGNMRLDAQPLVCSQPFTEKQKRAFVDYVRKRYKLPETIGLTLKKESYVRDTCFRELIFEGESALKSWELTLYASPDARFLSSDLFDTSIDPVIEQRANDEAVMKGLVQGSSATRGPENALVTIVEFSDFQCPYCRTFALILDDALSREEDDIRVVFHHLPLSVHLWSRMAAEAAGCAQLQSNEAFWSLHDRIFQNQDAITAENAKDKLAELATDSKVVDVVAFKKCVNSALSVGLVLKDMNVAESYQINATPTVFINGHRIRGVESVSKLREMIAEARKEAAARPSPSPSQPIPGEYERPKLRPGPSFGLNQGNCTPPR